MHDKIARDKIINDLDSNFIVDASAGSGKTYSLVRRIFSLLTKYIHFNKLMLNIRKVLISVLKQKTVTYYLLAYFSLTHL